jgi:hypothetical protein
LGWVLRGEFAGHADRQPVPAQQLARRRARPDSRQHLVFCSRQHNLTPTINDSSYFLPASFSAASTIFNAASIIDVNISQGTLYYATLIDKKACKINKLTYAWNLNALTIGRKRNAKNGW